MWIKAVNLNYSPKGSKDFRFEIGETYRSENKYCFCDTAFATLEYFENPLKTKYLEIECLSEITDLSDSHSFNAEEIRVAREIPIQELRNKDERFNNVYIHYEKKAEEAFEKCREMINVQHEVNEKKYENDKKRFRVALIVALIPMALLILLYIVVPLVWVSLSK